MGCDKVLEVASVTFLAVGMFGLGMWTHEKLDNQTETVRVLECTNDGQTFIPLSTVNENIRATIMGNGVVWSVSNNEGLPFIYAQTEGEVCKVKEGRQ